MAKCLPDYDPGIPERRNPLNRIAVAGINFYRVALSPLLGRACRFYPTCSCYGELCFRYLPLHKAAWLTFRRIGRCNPYMEGGEDFPPGLPKPFDGRSGNLSRSATMFEKEATFIMIKPDAVADGHSGKILARIEQEGFRIRGLRKTLLSVAEAREFYKVHAARPFYGELCDFMASGPIVAAVLERDNAVSHWRNVIGATDPAEAAEGTIRKLYARSKGENAVHGSDSTENAAIEIAFFFAGRDLLG